MTISRWAAVALIVVAIVVFVLITAWRISNCDERGIPRRECFPRDRRARTDTAAARLGNP